MALDSNAIWAALKDRLVNGTSGFTRISRQRRDWALEEHPVLMVLDDEGDEILISDPTDPSPTWRLTGQLIILARNNSMESAGDEFPEALNALKTSVMSALERQTTDPVGSGWTHYSDLGGLVRLLSVSKIEKGLGEKTGQSVTRISLEMETNPP